MKVRRGYTTRTSTQAPLSRHFCAESRPRCRRLQGPFPGRHLMSRWRRLPSRPFLLYFRHLSSRSPQSNHHLLVVIWNLKCWWEPVPPTPIKERNHLSISDLGSLWYILGQFLSSLLFLLAAINIRVDHLTRSLQNQKFIDLTSSLYNHYPHVPLWPIPVVPFIISISYNQWNTTEVVGYIPSSSRAYLRLVLDTLPASRRNSCIVCHTRSSSGILHAGIAKHDRGVPRAYHG